MAGLIDAIDMGICRLATLVAPGNHFFGNTFSQPIVENKILTPEHGGQPFFPDLEEQIQIRRGIDKGRNVFNKSKSRLRPRLGEGKW